MKSRLSLLGLFLACAICVTMSLYCIGCGGGGTTTSYTVQLVKTDGTVVETSEGPIPIGSKILITLEKAVTSESERNGIVAKLSVVGSAGAAVDGGWAWNEAYTELTFTPSKRFAYQTEYTLETSSTSTTASVGKALAAGSYPFTTMVQGDVNGDGYADLVIGAPGWDPAGISDHYGALYVFNGSESGVATTYTVRQVGAATDEYLGIRWATGDFNGDGYDDVIFGAPGTHPGITAPYGAAYVYYGSADGIPETPSVSIAGQNEEYLGWLLDNAGDINGDGFDDIIISAPFYNDGAKTAAGKVDIFYGTADGISATPSTSLVGGASYNQLGFYAAAAGDVNGDGIDDICVALNPDTDNGYVHIHLGSSSGIGTTPATTLEGENANDGFGFPATGIGDVNGDGYADVAVGAAGYDVLPANDEGAVYIYYGSGDGIPTTFSKRIVAETDKTEFGYGVAGQGDIDGDGYDDLILGAHAYNSESGRAYVYSGSVDGIGDTPAKTLDGSAGESFGLPLPGRDYNGDGYPDSAINALGYDSERGAEKIYYGSASGLGDTPTVITGEQQGDYFGTYLPN